MPSINMFVYCTCFVLQRSVNIGQTAFEAIGQIVKRIQNMLELKFDRHGRNSLLMTYIHYSCTLPHPDTSQPC